MSNQDGKTLMLNLPESFTDSAKRLMSAFEQLVVAQLAMSRGVSPPLSTSSPQSQLSPLEPPSEEEKQWLEGYLKELEPDIQKQTAELVKSQVREWMLMGGNIKAIKERLKGGKKAKIVRKKEGRRDPLYLQFGDGVEEPIEEVYLLG